jgi:hypothetical protein
MYGSGILRGYMATYSSTLPNTLATNATKSSQQVTKSLLSARDQEKYGAYLSLQSGGKSQFDLAWNKSFSYEDQSQAEYTRAVLLGTGRVKKDTLVGGADNTINGQPIPTSGTNDPSMFLPGPGDGLTASQRSAKYNQPLTPTVFPTATAPGVGGGGSSNPISSVQQAYNDALRANSQQALQYQQESVAAAFQANAIQNQLNKNLTDLIGASQQQAAQSQEALTKAISGLQSGAKGAQTGMEAVDVSEQMAKEDAKRRDLRRTSAADTKKAGLLSQKALLSKPTLLGV